jgi:hypothetical protein
VEDFGSDRLSHAAFWRALSIELWLRRVVHGQRVSLGPDPEGFASARVA